MEVETQHHDEDPNPKLATEQDKASSVTLSSVASVASMRPKVDRRNTCPMLLRLYCSPNHHPLRIFSSPETLPTSSEIQIHTWRDATLKELSLLIQSVLPSAANNNVRFDFRLIYLDLMRGAFMPREVGAVFNDREGKDDLLTLEDLRFVQGDYIDVAIQTTESGAHIAKDKHDSNRREFRSDRNSNRRNDAI